MLSDKIASNYTTLDPSGLTILNTKKKYHRVLPSFFQHLAWIPLRVSMRFFCSLEIRGVENVKELNSNMIFASNHTSELDPLLIVACLPFFSKHLPLYFVSREKSFYKNRLGTLFYGGTFFRMMGAYPAFVGLHNYKHALTHHLKLIQEGKNIVIFPMGKIYLQNTPAKPRGGATFLARRTQLPIIPVSIRGIEQFTLADFLHKKRKLIVTFGKPIYSKDLFQGIDNVVVDEERNDYEKASSLLMEKILKLG